MRTKNPRRFLKWTDLVTGAETGVSFAAAGSTAQVSKTDGGAEITIHSVS